MATPPYLPGALNKAAADHALLRELYSDVRNMMRRMDHLSRPPLHHSGSPNTGGVAGGGLSRATLTADLKRTSTATATLTDGTGTVTLDGENYRGYGFSGDTVLATKIGDTWYAIGSGWHQFEAALDSELTDGSTATVTFKGSSRTVNETLGLGSGSIASGKNVVCRWDEGNQQWNAGPAEC